MCGQEGFAEVLCIACVLLPSGGFGMRDRSRAWPRGQAQLVGQQPPHGPTLPHPEQDWALGAGFSYRGYATIDRTLSFRTNDIVLTALLASRYQYLFRLRLERRETVETEKEFRATYPAQSDIRAWSDWIGRSGDLPRELHPFVQFNSSHDLRASASTGAANAASRHAKTRRGSAVCVRNSKGRVDGKRCRGCDQERPYSGFAAPRDRQVCG
jgi:hypothetical protein